MSAVLFPVDEHEVNLDGFLQGSNGSENVRFLFVRLFEAAVCEQIGFVLRDDGIIDGGNKFAFLNDVIRLHGLRSVDAEADKARRLLGGKPCVVGCVDRVALLGGALLIQNLAVKRKVRLQVRSDKIRVGTAEQHDGGDSLFRFGIDGALVGIELIVTDGLADIIHSVNILCPLVIILRGEGIVPVLILIGDGFGEGGDLLIPDEEVLYAIVQTDGGDGDRRSLSAGCHEAKRGEKQNNADDSFHF